MLAAWVGAKKVGGWEKDRMFSKREEVYEARGKKGKKVKCFQGRQREMEWPKVDTKLG